MEFLSRLSCSSHGYNGIWVIVDWLTKSVYFISIHMSFNTEIVSLIYVYEIIYMHTRPISIISNWGSVLTSRF